MNELNFQNSVEPHEKNSIDKLKPYIQTETL